jgi:hypothetical protein
MFHGFRIVCSPGIDRSRRFAAVLRLRGGFVNTGTASAQVSPSSEHDIVELVRTRYQQLLHMRHEPQAISQITEPPPVFKLAGLP